MSRVYVVREKWCNTESRYFARSVVGRWSTAQALAERYKTRAEAAFWAGKVNGRVVRLVTLSEQLRRAKKRIAELEEAAAMGGAELNRLRFDKSLVGVNEQLERLHTRIASATPEYQQGRADERAAVADSLRLEAGHFDEMSRGPGAVACDYAVTLELARQAKRIESGEHVKGGGK